MSSYGKFSLGWLCLLLSATQLHAQWGLGNPQTNSMTRGGRCQEISVLVTDVMGVGIMGANVKTETSVMEMTTDAEGIVTIPCRSVHGVISTLSINAPGYMPARVTLKPNDLTGYETIRLDRRGPEADRSAGTTVNVAELSGNVQKQSAALQQQGEKALADREYERAEKLFLEALQLTPSSASVANNLGVISLHHKDLESAGKWFEKAAGEAPFKAEILGNLGLVRCMQGRTEEGYAILVKAFSRGYESYLGHYILGTVDLEKGQSKEAVEHLKKVDNGRFPYRDFYLSLALRNCGKTKAADEMYQSFLRRNPAPFLVAGTH